MSIITVSRGSYSYGKEIAEKVAEKLKYECISREILLEASSHFHVPELKLVHAVHDSPTFLDRFSHGKEKFVSYIRYTLLKHMQKDNIVYHGLAGHFFLQGVDHVLKVRVIADLDKRVEVVMKRDNVSEEKARRILKKDDTARHKWSHSLYGIDTSDPSLYDIVLHISKLTVDDAVDLITHTLQQPAFQTSSESQAKLDDLLLAVRIEMTLMNEYPLVSVALDQGVARVTLRGDIKQIDAIKLSVEKLVRDMAEVKSVEVNVKPISLDVRF